MIPKFYWKCTESHKGRGEKNKGQESDTEVVTEEVFQFSQIQCIFSIGLNLPGTCCPSTYNTDA